MEDLAREAIQEALKLGVEYADIRLGQSRDESLLVENGQVGQISSNSEIGAGIRVLASGAWGFYSTSSLSKESILETLAYAHRMAKASSQHARKPVTLARTKVVTDKDYVTVKQKAEDFPLDERVNLAKRCHSAMIETSQRIRRTSVGIAADVESKFFSNTEGTSIQQDSMKCYLSLGAVAHEAGQLQNQSQIEGGMGGFEIFQEMDPVKLSAELARKVSDLVIAPCPKSEETTVILDQDFVALLAHEIIGHPSEADRVLGREAAWAGTAWWKGMIGQRVGSEELNASDDSRIAGGSGYYEYDDEGVPGTEKVLIKDGILTNHMHSRETASIFETEPNGGMRASGNRFMPLIRMSNTFIKPKDWTLDEMIEDVDHGVYVVGHRVPSIDSRRYNWLISCKWAYLIKKGEMSDLLRNVSISGTAPTFFSSIDAVGKDFIMRPVPSCGKGDPLQQLRVGNGGPHIRGKAFVVGATDKAK